MYLVAADTIGALSAKDLRTALRHGVDETTDSMHMK
jgi:hypothetical protein